MSVPKDTSLWKWLRNEKIILIALGVLIGNAVGRLLLKFTEYIASPLLRAAFNEDPSNASYVQIGDAQLQVRAFLISLFEFALVVVLAYLLVKNS